MATVRNALRAIATLAGIAACVALAGCGAPAAATTYPATCRVLSVTPDPTLAPTALQANRPANGAAGLAAFSRCVTDATRVRALYAAAFTLPRTTGIAPCPKGFGVIYNLTVLHGSLVVRQMTLTADACLYLYISHADIRFAPESFQKQVADTLGLPWLAPELPFTDGNGIT